MNRRGGERARNNNQGDLGRGQWSSNTRGNRGRQGESWGSRSRSGYDDRDRDRGSVGDPRGGYDNRRGYDSHRGGYGTPGNNDHQYGRDNQGGGGRGSYSGDRNFGGGPDRTENRGYQQYRGDQYSRGGHRDDRGYRGGGGQRFRNSSSGRGFDRGRGSRSGGGRFFSWNPGFGKEVAALFSRGESRVSTTFQEQSQSALKALGKQLPESVSSAVSKLTLGMPLELNVNYFKLLNTIDYEVHQFDVSIKKLDKNGAVIEPSSNDEFESAASKPVREIIVNCAISRILEAYGQEMKFKMVYDGDSFLYVLGSVSDVDSQHWTYNHRDRFVAQFTEVLELNMLMEGLNVAESSRVPIQTSRLRSRMAVIDTVLKYALSRRLENYGRSFFDLSKPPEMELGNLFAMYSGFFVSSCVSFEGLMLNVDTAHTVIMEKKRLIDFLGICGFQERDLIASSTNEQTLQRMNDLMQNHRKIVVQYECGKEESFARFYRFVEFTLRTPDQISFVLDEGNGEAPKTVTIAQYYRQRYGYDCDTRYVTVASGKNADVFIPLERIWLPTRKVPREESEKYAADMIRKTAKPPTLRHSAIMDKVSFLNQSTQSRDECATYLKTWNIKADSKMALVHARVLRPPELFGSVRIDDFKYNGAWRTPINFQYFQRTPSTPSGLSWAFVVFPDVRIEPRAVVAFLENIAHSARLAGVALQPKGTYLGWEKDDFVPRLLEYVTSGNTSHLTYFVCSGSGNEYQVVKSICELSAGLVSQFIQAVTIERKANRQVFENICHKLCAKLGGINLSLVSRERSRHQIFDPLRGCFHATMFVGLDVTHSVFKADKKMSRVSIAAVVASMDSFPHLYSTEICLQKNPKSSRASVEIVYNMQNIMERLLKKYHSRNSFFPERIIVYRDGVSDGQFSQVVQYELNALLRATAKVNPKGKIPKVAVIVAQKRHHLRMFPIDPKFTSPKNGNVLPGTVTTQDNCVDTIIDAYLCSHVGIQGTSKPTRYRLVFDTIGLDHDQLLTMTYSLCHLYAKCFRAVSIPAPCYYAHHVAFRARYYVDFLSMCDRNIKEYLFEDALKEKNNKTNKIDQPTPSISDRTVKFMLINLPSKLDNMLFFC